MNIVFEVNLFGIVYVFYRKELNRKKYADNLGSISGPSRVGSSGDSIEIQYTTRMARFQLPTKADPLVAKQASVEGWIVHITAPNDNTPRTTLRSIVASSSIRSQSMRLAQKRPSVEDRGHQHHCNAILRTSVRLVARQHGIEGCATTRRFSASSSSMQSHRLRASP